jgi:hypothetical protein
MADHIMASASVLEGVFGRLLAARLTRSVATAGEVVPRPRRPRPWLVLGVAVATLAFWHSQGRPLSDLGFAVSAEVWYSTVLAAFAGIAGAAILNAYGRRVLASARVVMPIITKPRFWDFMRSALIAVSEEVYFRGFLLWYFGAYWINPAAGVVLVACVFAWLHGPAHWTRYAMIGLLSVAFGASVLHSRSLLPACLGHLAFNFTMMLLRSHDPSHRLGKTRDSA